MIDAHNLTKRYGKTVAVDDLSFTVKPGIVTGCLGPNGAGKTTTLRLILGLDRPSGGEVTVGGRRYRDLPAPLREVGALIDAKAIHPGRSAYKCLAQSNGIPNRRVLRLRQLAIDKHLWWSGGSDFHGPSKPAAVLGGVDLPENVLEQGPFVGLVPPLWLKAADVQPLTDALKTVLLRR